jgi:protein subunit release factor B
LQIFKLRVKILPMLRDEDIVEIFHRSSGPGGQHVNKVSTAVTLKHLPTGLIVTASDSRSQSQNRALARSRLAGKLEESARRKKLDSLADASRERRRKARRSRGTKTRMVEGKRRRSETKKLRGKVAAAG